jgi:hypothetical protein
MDVALAIIYHDPQGQLYQQIVRTLPTLTHIFGGVTVRASHIADKRSLALFVSAGALVEVQSLEQAAQGPKLGLARRTAVALALQLNYPFVFYCDCDRVLHWADLYPEELAQVAACVADYDFTVLGRTSRAFDSHPHIQRDTEAIVNHVFKVVSGHAWDVVAGARGLSRRAAEAILTGCADEELSTDVSWPLFLERAGGFSLGYMAAEGLEFETADRYSDDVARVGGQAQWLAQLDADPRQWAHRLDLARLEIEGMVPYAEKV